jgi:hypothetical protein
MVGLLSACVCTGCAPASTSSNSTKTGGPTANVTAPASPQPAAKSTPKKTPTTAPTPAQAKNVPVINAFNAGPAIVSAGGRSTLTWEVSNAGSITISPGVGSVSGVGTVIVSPATSTKYTLKATNTQGTSTSSATVMVESKYSTLLPVVLAFTINPLTISDNDTCTISWDVFDASSVSITAGAGQQVSTLSTKLTPKGTMPVTPHFVSPAAFTTIPSSGAFYTLTATNVTGSTIVSRDVTVLTKAILPLPGIPIAYENITVSAVDYLPMVRWFAADPVTVIQGNSATLSWEVYGATKVVLNGVEVAHTGNRTVSPAAAATYTLTASNQYWTMSKALTVNVLPYKAEWFKPVIQ